MRKRWRAAAIARIAAIAWTLLSSPAIAAPVVVRHFGSAQGMPVGTAERLAIDGDGFLWAATHDGLARFDGQRFKTFDLAAVPAMSENRIVDVVADARGDVHALTYGGVLLRARASHVERALPAPERRESTVRFLQREPLCATLDSGLYCAGADGVYAPVLSFDHLPGVSAALRTPQGEIWLVVRRRGVWLQSGDERRTVLQQADLDLDEADRPDALVDPDGGLWIAMRQGLLHATRDGTARALRAEDGLPYAVGQLRWERDGLWVGTDRGLFRVRDGLLHRADADVAPGEARSWRAPDGALWTASDVVLRREGREVLRVHGRPRQLLFAEDGSTWVATLRDGVYALSRARVETLGTADSESDNVYGIAYDADGVLWTGTLGEGLCARTPEGSVRIYGRADGLPGENIWVVAAAPEGDIYAASYRPGLFMKPRGAVRFASVALPEALRTAQVRALSFGADGRLWIGTSEGAWRRDDDGWQAIWPDLGSADVAAILHARDGAVWFAGSRGVWRWRDGASHEVAAEALAGARARHLFEDAAGAVWISTAGRGLFRIAADDTRGRAPRRLGRADGLPSDSPHALLQDDAGHLWVNSNQGVFRIARDDLAGLLAGRHATLSPLTLGAADGLVESEGNGGVQPAAAVDAQRRLLFPTQRGVVRIVPQDIQPAARAPQPVVEAVLAQGRALSVEELAHQPGSRRTLQFRYVAADLHAAGTLRFRHRLLPLESDWTDAGPRESASYAALAPGRYRFEVAAANSDGVWSPQPAAVEFGIAPYWHETAAARAAFALATVLLLVAFLRARTRRWRRLAATLDGQVAARTADLAQQNQRQETLLAELAASNAALSQAHRDIERSNHHLAEQAQRLENLDEFRVRLLADVTHELRTALMLVRLPLAELRGADAELAPPHRRRLLQAGAASERLGTLVEQLITLVRAEARQLTLALSSLDLCAFVYAAARSYEPAAASVGLRIEVCCYVERQYLFADPLQLTTILNNLLDNACKYAPPRSAVRVVVGVERDGARARVAVIDRGPGFPRADADALFQRFHRGGDAPRQGRASLGLGLALARELVQLHGGCIGATSDPNCGTEFWFELPLGSTHVAVEEIALDAPAPAGEPHQAASGDTPPDPGGNGDSELPDDAHDGDDEAARGGVLLVEDHPHLAAYLRELLADHFPVAVVGSAEAALAWLSRRRPGVVVADVLLPQMNGLLLCERLRFDAHCHDVPVVLISAQEGHNDRDAAIAAGAADYLKKPFALQDLLGAIARCWPEGGARLARFSGTRADAEADPLLRLVAARLEDPEFGIVAWAALAHLSERQLRRRVTELTGTSPQAWLREQRLLNVRRLIGSGECRTLAQAGLRSGLDNPSYLYRVYRARFGPDETR